MSTRSYRRNDVKFDVHYPPSTPEIFVDGIDQTLLGFPNAKIIFYQTVRAPDEENVAQRQSALRLVMPAATLVEFCKRTLASYSKEVEKFPELATQQVARVRKAVGLDQQQAELQLVTDAPVEVSAARPGSPRKSKSPKPKGLATT